MLEVCLKILRLAYAKLEPTQEAKFAQSNWVSNEPQTKQPNLQKCVVGNQTDFGDPHGFMSKSITSVCPYLSLASLVPRSIY